MLRVLGEQAKSTDAARLRLVEERDATTTPDGED
jgi:hypothetical protein